MFPPHALPRLNLSASNPLGFTLVEAILSLMILGGVAATAVSLYTTGLKSITAQQVRLQLDSAARSRMEQLLATNYTSLSAGSSLMAINNTVYTIAWTITPIDIDGDGTVDSAARRIDVTTQNATLSTIVTDNQGCVGKL